MRSDNRHRKINEIHQSYDTLLIYINREDEYKFGISQMEKRKAARQLRARICMSIISRSAQFSEPMSRFISRVCG